jgi:hypothetical protein
MLGAGKKDGLPTVRDEVRLRFYLPKGPFNAT